MALTQRFGFKKFGGPAGGSLTDDGYRFSTRDRDVLDRLLEAFELHEHRGGTRLADPTAAPALEQLDLGGFLPAATTFYYRVGFVDRFGLESRASAEASIRTPDPVTSPGQPILSYGSGGTLGQGTYYYALTAIAGEYETQLSNPGIITLSNQGTVVIELPALPVGADEFGIWRMGPNEAGYTKIGVTTAATIEDNGSVPPDDCPCDPTKLPPDANRTKATNVVTITVPDAASVGADPSDIKAWRIYRSTQSGIYQGASLIAEVTDTTEEFSGGLITEFMDIGFEPAPGSPLDVSQTLTPSTLVEGGGNAPILLEAPGGTTWKVYAGLDGALNTRSVAVSAARGLVLYSLDLTAWQLSVGDDGGLVTTEVAAAGADDSAFMPGAGPFIPTPDPTILYQLGVENDGALTTLEA